MTFPRYLFLSYYQYTEYWWTDPILRSMDHKYDPENCTVRELTDAIFGSLAMEYFPVATPGTENEPTDVGYVSGLSESSHSCILVITMPVSATLMGGAGQ